MSELKKFIEMSFLEDMTKEEINAVLNKQHAEIERLKGACSDSWDAAQTYIDKSERQRAEIKRLEKVEYKLANENAKLRTELEQATGELEKKEIESLEVVARAEMLDNFNQDEIKTLQAKLDQATRWRDIESAPRDGKLFLAHNDGMDYDIVSWDGHRFTDYQYDRYSFKRWLPLPAPEKVWDQELLGKFPPAPTGDETK